MSPYLDVTVIPVPRAKLDLYKKMSAEWGKAHLRHGAMYFSDAVGEDVQPGKLTSFPQAVQLQGDEVVAVSWVVYASKEDRDRIAAAVREDPQLKDDEVIALAWVVYASKADRDRIGKAVMEDPQLKDSMDPSKMPFDGKRMFWGGFESIIGLAGGK